MASAKASGAPGYEWVGDAEEAYSLAAEYASDVLNGQSTYSLDPDLGNIYDVEHQADGPEHIFITSMNREASGMEGTYSQLPQMFCIQISDYVYVSKSLNPGPGTPEVMKVLNDPSTYQVMRVDNEFMDTYDDNDLRKQLMVTTIYNEDGSVLATYDPSNISSSDNIWVNAVRARAGLDPLPEGLSIEDFREAVIQERVKELAFEGHGLYDLRRLNRADEEHITNKTFHPTYAYFFPVPQRESDLNPQE